MKCTGNPNDIINKCTCNSCEKYRELTAFAKHYYSTVPSGLLSVDWYHSCVLTMQIEFKAYRDARVPQIARLHFDYENYKRMAAKIRKK